MEAFVVTIHVIVALFLILVVLVQGGNQGGIGAAFGGGNSQGYFGAGGATTFLGKLTYAAAFIFMLTSISLTVIQGGIGQNGLGDRLKQSAGQARENPTLPYNAPADTPAPAEGTTPAPSETDATAK